MNLVLCVLNDVSKYICKLVLFWVIISVICNVLGSMSDMRLVERSPRNTNTLKIHRCKHIDDFNLRADCESWSCWESQLRDQSRIEFLDIYNNFRTGVIQQECQSCLYYEDYPVMIQLQWHWKLEQESQKAIKNCPYQDFRSNLKIELDDDYLNETNAGYCETTATSFPIFSGSQSELIQMLPHLLYGNHLRDFDENNRYRRNLALYIGCSYVPRVLTSKQMHSANPTLKKSVGHLLCNYCSREKAIHSAVDKLLDCPTYATKLVTNEFPLLCKLKSSKITMPCESTFIPCPSRKKSYSWIFPRLSDVVARLDNGTDLQMADYTNHFNLTFLSDSHSASKNDTPKIITIEVTPRINHNDPYDKKFCILFILIYFFILALMISPILLICHYRILVRRAAQ